MWLFCLLLTEKEEITFSDEEDKEEWEEEQKRLDREWYGLDEGYDDDHNPFSGMSEQYKKKKEEELEEKKKKKMSARQRQINRVSYYGNVLYTVTHMISRGICTGQRTAVIHWRAIDRFYPVS